MLELDKVYLGDCLDVMQAFESKTMDLIYIDPPFFTMRHFVDFDDYWPTINEYIVWLRLRIEVCYRILKDTGSLYLHCDWHASHYIKVALDNLFGYDNFQREIIWRVGWVSGYKSIAKNWIRNHDTILFYTKNRKDFTFNKIYLPYAKDYKRWCDKPRGKGYPIEDVWNVRDGEHITSLAHISFSKEKLDYPTQKPITLLERIIKVSSNEEDIILDPMCGCGTTLVAAKKLKRHYIGIDSNSRAIELSNQRLSSLLTL